MSGASRFRRIVVYPLVAAVLLVGTSAATWWFTVQSSSSAEAAAVAQAPQRTPVTVPVSAGPIEDVVTLHGTVTSGITRDVPAPHGGKAQPVVTALNVSSGDTLVEGAVPLHVAGRPVIVFEGDFPLYRDLSYGDVGPDVLMLAQALARLGYLRTAPSNTYNDALAAAVTRLYHDIGSSPPTAHVTQAPTDSATTGKNSGGKNAQPRPETTTITGGRFPMAESLVISELPVQVGVVRAAVGDKLADSPLSIVLGRPQVVVKLANPRAADALTHAEPTVRFADGPLSGPAQLTTIVDPATGAKGKAGAASAVRKARFAVPEGTDPPAPGTRQAVEVVLGTSPEDTLVVPDAALWADGSGTKVITVSANGTRTDVPVEVVLSASGRNAIRPLGGKSLSRGDEVLVAYRWERRR